MAAVPPDHLSDVLITEQLHRRVPHNADYKREKLAIQELAQQMVDHPEGLMPGLVSLAIGAVSGDKSLRTRSARPRHFPLASSRRPFRQFIRWHDPARF